MEFTRKTFNGSFDPIWRGECKVLPGGYKPTNDIPTGAVVKRGTPVEIDTENLTCVIGKSATIIEGGDTTHLRIAKGLLFVTGDTITIATTDNSAAATTTITAIDTTNSDYDVLTVDTAVDALYVYTACSPNAIVAADYENKGLGIITLDIAYEAVVLYKGLAAPIADDWKDGIHLKGNPSIKLITQ